jgi:hypothetical protein
VAQASDQAVPIGKSVRPNVVRDTGRHDLLGPPAADAEQEFDRGPVDERTGERLKLPDDIVDFAVPGGFCGRRGDSLC